MKSLNRVTLLGNLTRDPEAKFTTNGTAVTNLALATNERFKGKDGEWTDRPEYHTIVLWQRLAEIAGEYLKKGSKCFIEGRLQTRSYEKDGTKKYVTEVVASDLILLDGKSSEKPAQQTAPAPIEDSDLPF